MTKYQIPSQNLKPVNDLLRKEIDLQIKEVLDRQCFILGPKLEEFESSFAATCKTNHCIGVGNGTDAITMSLVAGDVKPNDEVILPSFTHIATAHAVTTVGAIPVFVDIQKDSFNIDPVAVQNAITEKTKAIVAVNLFGHPCDYDKLPVAESDNLLLIEDNAQAQGAKYKQRICGGIGRINATSFYPTKNIGAMGDGGAITTNSSKVARFLRDYRSLGTRKQTISSIYGRNSRLDELQAAILLVKLKYLKRFNEERANIAKQYTKKLSNISKLKTPTTLPGTVPVWHQYTVQTECRDELMIHLQQNGIGSAMYYPVPCHLQLPYVGSRFQSLPNSEYAAKTVLSLPCYPGLTEDEIDYICSVITSYFEN